MIRAAVAGPVLVIACAAPPSTVPLDAPSDAVDVVLDATEVVDAATERDAITTSDTTDVTASDVATDGPIACFVDGEGGTCIATTVCAAMAGYRSTAGHCPGAADIECCTRGPNVADNPPIPTGFRLMQQSEVTAAMTAWAVAILHDPATYPMFSTTMMTFGTTRVLARVEWHPPDFQNAAVHRGVTLYVPV